MLDNNFKILGLKGINTYIHTYYLRTYIHSTQEHKYTWTQRNTNGCYQYIYFKTELKIKQT